MDISVSKWQSTIVKNHECLDQMKTLLIVNKTVFEPYMYYEIVKKYFDVKSKHFYVSHYLKIIKKNCFFLGTRLPLKHKYFPFSATSLSIYIRIYIYAINLKLDITIKL